MLKIADIDDDSAAHKLRTFVTKSVIFRDQGRNSVTFVRSLVAVVHNLTNFIPQNFVTRVLNL